jgi:anti-sigma factor ChrR (cupin superfamily)
MAEIDISAEVTEIVDVVLEIAAMIPDESHRSAMAQKVMDLVDRQKKRAAKRFGTILLQNMRGQGIRLPDEVFAMLDRWHKEEGL